MHSVKIEKHEKSSVNTVIYHFSDPSLYVVINPGYFSANELGLVPNSKVSILITHVDLDTCSYLSVLRSQQQAHFLTHQDFLGSLQFLSQEGEKAGLCGVYTPQADVVWKDPKGFTPSLNLHYERYNQEGMKKIRYKIGDQVLI